MSRPFRCEQCGQELARQTTGEIRPTAGIVVSSRCFYVSLRCPRCGRVSVWCNVALRERNGP